MNVHKQIILSLIGSLALSTALETTAADSPKAADTNRASTGVAATSAASKTEGEIRKVDLEAKKITIKHGDIKNLDMPGMTMSFQVRDPASLTQLTQLKVGDRIKFSAEKEGGAFIAKDFEVIK